MQHPNPFASQVRGTLARLCDFEEDAVNAHSMWYYCEVETRRLQRQCPSREALNREEWHAQYGGAAASGVRAAATWIGDRLVGAGERLRAWAASAAPAPGAALSGPPRRAPAEP